ncbi:tripartite tricarboxylate transporter substrate binding protein [Pseudorhodoferax sp. Leaf274]|uniref:tripartite tricarboxylate transporter substrate binding protein n=1 Tax=Pseudorhodoferax sp. Leaf274 TaxID=1736318 RepID=UPI0007027426|nr:tripartite tricarboxylate transporter substrate binding protein [Pseudorhodoferax sp. Leaf274]KQP37146.1 ABC transporter substrate-binding protein [Pseudorhodoferax sp. Leaf274]
MQKTRRRLAAALCALATGLVAGGALAQAYPSKPVKLVVPYPPGGPTDIVARVIAQRLQTQTGQPFDIENLAGAGGNTGAAAVARAAPDGYTLLVATTAHAINPSLFKNLSYQFGRDFAPITQLTSGPLVVVVNPALPARTVPELIALAKARPGDLNFASSGNGQSTHLAGELFNATAGTRIRHVPYKGSAPALTDTMAGQTQLMFDTMLSAMPHVKGGKLRAIAVTGAQRSPAAPDLPTVAETLPGFEAIAWNGLLAPAGTPREIVARLGAELRTAMEQPEVRERFEAQGFAAAWTTPEAFAGFIHAEIDKWAKVVQVSGATIE